MKSLAARNDITEQTITTRSSLHVSVWASHSCHGNTSFQATLTVRTMSGMTSRPRGLSWFTGYCWQMRLLGLFLGPILTFAALHRSDRERL